MMEKQARTCITRDPQDDPKTLMLLCTIFFLSHGKLIETNYFP